VIIENKPASKYGGKKRKLTVVVVVMGVDCAASSGPIKVKFLFY